jgi:predicted GNAT family N-acyltransferase
VKAAASERSQESIRAMNIAVSDIDRSAPAHTEVESREMSGVAASDHQLTIRLAKTDEEYDAAYRLRYQVYVKELGYKQSFANHTRQIVQDPLDATATVLIATIDNRVVGTLRNNVASDGDLGCFALLHRMHLLHEAYPSRVSMTSRLSVEPGFRNGRVFMKLVQALLPLLLERAIEFDFIDCEKKLLPLYARFGYRRTGSTPFEHPEVGPRIPMMIRVDPTFLRAIDSPVLWDLK